MKYLRYITGSIAISAATLAVILASAPVGAEVFKVTASPAALTAGQVTTIKGWVPNMPSAYTYSGYCSQKGAGWTCRQYGYGVDVVSSQFLAVSRRAGCAKNGGRKLGTLPTQVTGEIYCDVDLDAAQITALQNFIDAKWPAIGHANVQQISYETTIDKDTGVIGTSWTASPIYFVTTSDDAEIATRLTDGSESIGQVAQ